MVISKEDGIFLAYESVVSAAVERQRRANFAVDVAKEVQRDDDEQYRDERHLAGDEERNAAHVEHAARNVVAGNRCCVLINVFK